MSGDRSHIHFGSLEHAERERLAKLEEETKRRLEKLRAEKGGASSSAMAPAPAPAPTAETLELSGSSLQAAARQQELKESLAKRKRARELAVPTNDNQVKLKLREAGEPICLFGEGAPERRERLRETMTQHIDLDAPTIELRGAQTLDQLRPKAAMLTHDAAAVAPVEDRQKHEFYTEGSAELRAARVWILGDSVRRAAARLADERARVRAHCADVTAVEAEAGAMSAELSRVENQMSNFGDERPVSYCAFSPGSTLLATGSWSSIVKLWSIPDCRAVASLRGHTERITGLAWHPQATLGQSPTSLNLVSASCDETAKLWPLEGGKPVGQLKGHAARLSRVAFHPSGRYIGTASFDTTWRLWDAETCAELLLQEGHTRPLYGIAFHPDGALVATAGLDALVRLWDLRTGKSIQLFQGHVKQVLGLDFSPTGEPALHLPPALPPVARARCARPASSCCQLQAQPAPASPPYLKGLWTGSATEVWGNVCEGGMARPPSIPQVHIPPSPPLAPPPLPFPPQARSSRPALTTTRYAFGTCARRRRPTPSPPTRRSSRTSASRPATAASSSQPRTTTRPSSGPRAISS
eukprot:scaffold7991_cov106-Isochrysis_galbana.AAC.3